MSVRPTPLTTTLLLLLAARSWGAVAVECPRARLVLGDDGRWQSLIETATGREVVDPAVEMPFATVTVAGKEHPANAASLRDDRLELRFDGVDCRLGYRVEAADEWIRFELSDIAGTRPDRLVLVQVPTALGGHVGRRLNIAWDGRTSVCLLAANRQVDCGAAGKPAGLLRAASQDAPGPRLEGAAAALIVCASPDVRGVLQRASHAFGLLTNEDAAGVPSKETEDARGAYWFLTVGESDGDKVIDYCRRSGIHQVMIGSGSWCVSPGHYLFHEARFPDGEAGLKALVAQLHAAGIKVGMHTFVSKVAKRDPYVTPVPDRRFWVDREGALAGEVTADQTELRCTTDLREWPGSPVASQKAWEGGVVKHQEALLDDEIIQYEAIGPEGRWDTFLGCKRGAWGTAAAAHRGGTRARHYGVDGCINGYIIDQETDLLDEVAERAAGIFNRCDFDMVYFDGGEDVDRRRFNHYVSRFQEAAVSRFAKRPIIHMGTVLTHLLWHSFTRSSTVDTYLNTLYGAIQAGAAPERWPTVRDHIDRSVAYLLSVRDDLMPGELGWFGIWPKGPNTDGLQLDELEYLMAKSLAYDAPVSLETSFSQMESHPLTPGLLDLFRVYDELRMRRAVDEATRAELGELGQDFALVLSPDGPGFVSVTPLDQVGGGRDVRGCVGERNGEAVVTLWHVNWPTELLLDVPADEARVTDLEGRPVVTRAEGGKLLFEVACERLTLFLPGRTADQARELLARAKVQPKPYTFLRLEAEDYVRLVGSLAKGSAVGITEPEASGDVVVPTAGPNREQPQDWYCEYQVEVPHEGRWTLWARVRYPSGADESFGLVRPGETVTLDLGQVLGNCGLNEGRWHWTGRGSGSTTAPPGQAIVFALPPGPFTFRVYVREGSGDPQRAPRLDQLVLTDGPSPPPR